MNLFEGILKLGDHPDPMKALSQIDIWQYAGMEKPNGIRCMWIPKSQDNDPELITERERIITPHPRHSINEVPFRADGVINCGRGKRKQLENTLDSWRPWNEDLEEEEVDDYEESGWKNIEFVMTDAPQLAGDYARRCAGMYGTYQEAAGDDLGICEDWRFESLEKLQEKLEEISDLGGEGLWLRHRKTIYTPGSLRDPNQPSWIEIPCEPKDRALQRALQAASWRSNPACGQRANESIQQTLKELETQFQLRVQEALLRTGHLRTQTIRECMQAAEELIPVLGSPEARISWKGKALLHWAKRWGPKHRREREQNRERKEIIPNGDGSAKGFFFHTEAKTRKSRSLHWAGTVKEVIGVLKDSQTIEKADQLIQAKGMKRNPEEAYRIREPRTPLPQGEAMSWDIFKEKYADGLGRDDCINWPPRGENRLCFRLVHEIGTAWEPKFKPGATLIFPSPRAPYPERSRHSDGMQVSLEEADQLFEQAETDPRFRRACQKGRTLDAWIQGHINRNRRARAAIQGL